MLSDRGYHNLPALSKKKCDKIIERLEKITFRARTSTHEITGLDYDSAGSNIYEAIDQKQIQNIPEITKISQDTKILSVVEQFLECTPIQTQAACWWTVNYSKGEWEQCAQLFHQDLTYHRFVKLFLYLNHITMENGPHAYVPGSFHSMVTPQEHHMGQRVSDDFIKQHYSEIIYYTGERGTMFLEDTRGYHKGTPIKQGHRLLIQLEWADNITDIVTGEQVKQV